nr:MAG TPA: hypothetical protein [Caudoviricetes sp.]
MTQALLCILSPFDLLLQVFFCKKSTRQRAGNI